MLKGMKLELQRPVLRRALKSAAAPIVYRAKRNAARGSTKDSGLLSDSIGSKVKISRTGRVIVDIKPYGKPVVVRRRRPDGTTYQVRAKASKYAHHVEFGNVHMAAEPFMRPAADAGKAEAIKGFAAEVEVTIRRIEKKKQRAARRAARLAAKGGA